MRNLPKIETKIDSEVYERFHYEFNALKDKPLVPILISPLDIWIILSQMQLALRHPENKGASSKMARDIARQLQEIVAPEGALKQVAEMGWQEEFDE